VAAVALSLTLACAAGSGAQTAKESELKVAFLYNFAKFIEWPPEALPPNAPMTLCVAGDAGVSEALDQTVKGRSINGHDIVVAKPALDASAKSCHLLYVSGLDAKRAQQLIQALAGAPVFVVSDFDRFAQSGGVANFFRDSDRMRFAINVDAAHRARLHVSSRLLALATVVKDDGKPLEGWK